LGFGGVEGKRMASAWILAPAKKVRSKPDVLSMSPEDSLIGISAYHLNEDPLGGSKLEKQHFGEHLA